MWINTDNPQRGQLTFFECTTNYGACSRRAPLLGARNDNDCRNSDVAIGAFRMSTTYLFSVLQRFLQPGRVMTWAMALVATATDRRFPGPASS